MFTVVIPFWQGHRYIDKLLGTIPEAIPIVIVNDLDDSPSPEVNRPNVVIKQMSKKGYFTGTSNEGIRNCGTDVLILNQDTYFSNPDWLNFIEENHQQYGIFGERAGSHPAWPNRYVQGTFMYICRDVIDAIGMMDGGNYPHWGSTCEYQLRACRRGFKVNPVETVPGFIHIRRGPLGTATQQALDNVNRGKLIRTPPTVSVIITSFNYGRYLQDAVNSLIGGKTSLGEMSGQSFQSFEIVIVDDGSTDDSAQIAEKLADPWQGIHFVSQNNKGSAIAMNTGITSSHARSGTLIAPLDADDMMEPKRLERMVKALEKNPHFAIYDNIRYFGNGNRGVVTDWQTGQQMDRLDLKRYNFEQMLSKNLMHKGLLYSKRAWEEAGGYPAKMRRGREDWAFNIALGIKGYCGINTGEFDYLYRRELQNRTLTNTTKKHHQYFLSQIKSIFPNVYAGERPMCCCGGRKSGNNGVASMAARFSQDMPSEKGMVILEYIGPNTGDETWHGKSKTYLLGGARRRGYVNEEDVPTFLDIRENNKPIFIEIEPIETPQVEMSAFSNDKIENPILVGDVSGMKVGDIKRILNDLTLPQIEVLLKEEKKGKSRSTAIAAIEGALDDRLV